MQKLYELTENMVRVQEMLEAQTDPDNPIDEAADEEEQKKVLQDTFESIEMDYEQKIENCLKYMRSEESLANMYKEEADRLNKLKKAAENRAARIKEMMINSLDVAGYDYENKKKIQTTIGKVGFQKNPATLEFLEGHEKKIPYSYVSRVEKIFDKRALLKDIKEKLEDAKNTKEQEFDEWGVKYVNNKSHLRVR